MPALRFIPFLSLAILRFSYAYPSSSNSDCDPNSLIVDTSSGKYRPLIDPAFPDVAQYLGVPFAASPVGNLRFAPPQPANKTAGVTDATQYPPGCWQLLPAQENIFDVYEPGYIYNGSQSEDCLRLDVTLPTQKQQQPLPVLIFVYGGGFVTGAANTTFEKPPAWVQAKQDLIVVNIQYRSNIFGFPNSAGLQEQNVGLQDIRASVEWIRDNIAAFGGDTSRIVLWGQSAGSIAVSAYTYTYIEDPIVHGTISTSGNTLTPPGWKSSDFSHSNFTYVAGSASQLLACMRSKPALEINSFLLSNQSSSTLSFLPFPDESQVFANYTERLLQGKVANQPAILGSNRREGERSLDKNLNPNGPNQTEALAYTVVTFLCPAQLTAKLRNQIGIPTYRYEYKGNFTNLSPLPWMGAYHASPLPLLFGTSASHQGHPLTGPSSPFELAVGSHMQDLWRAFTYDPTSLVNRDWPLNQGGAVNQTTDAVKLFPGDNHTISSVEYGAVREQFCPAVDPYLISETIPSGDISG